MGAYVTREAILTVNPSESGFLDAVDDVAIVDISDLEKVSILVNRVVDGLDGIAAELDLGTLSDLDTIVQAAADGSAGNDITVAAVGDSDILTKAELDLDTPSTNLDTIIQAHTAGAAGNAITIRTVADGSGVGSFTRVGTALTFHYESGVTTVANFETAVGALAGADELIDVKTTGTAVNVLVAPGDTFAATPLAGGLDSEGVVIEETGTDVVIHFETGVSTVADVEAAILADSTLLAVKTAGTGATVLTDPDDAFAATPLAGGSDEGALSLVVEKSIDGTNYAPVATVDEDDFADGNGVGFEITLSDGNGMPLSARQVRVTVETLDETSTFSVVAVGTKR